MKKSSFVVSIFAIAISSAWGQTMNGFDTKVYGFIKASSMYSSQGLASYNNINLSAPTHAVPQTRSSDKISRMSFQTQQSRVGVQISKTDNLTGRLEFDFIDFNKSSPTTQMNPRIRIASITYKDGNNTFILGQDWDLFSPVTSYTFDIVGLYFLAGNSGFMRQQFQFLHKSEDWEFGTAVGMAGNNPGTADTDLETSKSPSFSGRASKSIEKGRIGVSGIFSRLSYQSIGESRRESFGINMFYERIFSFFAIKSEAYFGKNLANIGLLTIGKGTAVSDAKEYGGHLSIQKNFNEKDIIFGGLGLAKIDGSSKITPFSLSTTNTITNPGILNNFLARIGYERKISEDFSWLSELSRFETRSKTTASNEQLNVVGSIETGFLLRF